MRSRSLSCSLSFDSGSSLTRCLARPAQIFGACSSLPGIPADSLGSILHDTSLLPSRRGSSWRRQGKDTANGKPRGTGRPPQETLSLSRGRVPSLCQSVIPFPRGHFSRNLLFNRANFRLVWVAFTRSPCSIGTKRHGDFGVRQESDNTKQGQGDGLCCKLPWNATAEPSHLPRTSTCKARIIEIPGGSRHRIHTTYLSSRLGTCGLQLPAAGRRLRQPKLATTRAESKNRVTVPQMFETPSALHALMAVLLKL
jgi:hypothetical protein